MQSGRQDSRGQSTEQVNASYRQFRRKRATQAERWKVEGERRGVLALWLALTAPPLTLSSASLVERERRRKAELSAYVLFGVLVTGVALIPNGLVNRPTLFSAIVIIGSAVLAGALNRADRTTAAALLLIGAFSVGLGSALVTTPTLDLTWMPALDFFAVPVLLAGLLLSRRAPLAVAGLGIAAVVALLELKPRDATLAHLVTQLGIYHFMVRPVMLMAIVAIASWLWARSVEQAITRADRAEEIAAIEHVLAEQKRQMERGIQSLLETHVRVANGDFSARATTGQENVLWQIGVSLNNLLSRLSKLAQADQRLQRTEAEIDRLAMALEETRAGRSGAWPRLSGTRVDRLLRLLSSTQQPRLPAPRSPQPTGTVGRAEVTEVPEGVPGGKIPPWDGSGLTPVTGVWRAEPGHYSTARDTLGSYGSGSLRAVQPNVPAQGSPLESLHGWHAAWLPHASVPGQRSEQRPAVPDLDNNGWPRSAHFAGSLPDSGKPASINQAPLMWDQPQGPSAAPLAPWPGEPLPPLPPSPWAMPEPLDQEGPPARSEPLPGMSWRIVGDADPVGDERAAGESMDGGNPVDEAVDDIQAAAQSDRERWKWLTSLRASFQEPE
jgi:hypothetical protein